MAGDWNSSLYRNTTRDKKFQSFCKTQGIFPANQTNNSPSYHGYNGSVSKIDYILVHRDYCLVHGIQIEDVRIIKQICIEENPYIISTHDALYFEVKYDVKTVNEENENVLACEAVEVVKNT